MHHEYETIVIARPDLDDATVGAVLDKLESVVSDNGGHILDRDDWGKRKMAYAIDKQLKGHYIRMHLAAPATVIAELERRIRLEDQLVRFMTVQLAKAVNVEERAEAAAVIRAAREEEARKRAEAEAAAVFGEVHVHEAELPGLRHDGAGPLAGLVVVRHVRTHFFFGEVAGEFLQLQLLVVEGEVDHRGLLPMQTFARL